MANTDDNEWDIIASETFDNSDEEEFSGLSNTDEEFWIDSESIRPIEKVDVPISLEEDVVNMLKDYGSNISKTVNTILRAHLAANKALQRMVD